MDMRQKTEDDFDIPLSGVEVIFRFFMCDRLSCRRVSRRLSLHPSSLRRLSDGGFSRIYAPSRCNL